MASPLHTFRKNQKLMMAVITIMAMVAFVFFGPWSGMGGPEPQGPKDNDVFTWKYGTVTQAEIQHAAMLRQMVNHALLTAAEKAGVMTNQTARELQMLFPSDPQQVASAMMLSKKAEQLGLVADDRLVNQFLREITGGKLTDVQISEIINSTQFGNRGHLTEADVFETLRWGLQSIYAQNVFSRSLDRGSRFGYGYGFAGDTPADRWNYYCQLNRKATAQIHAVAVADFVSQVADPSDAELQSFYDKYKNQEPNPRSKEPGFTQPYRAKFQYFKANYDQMVAEEKPKITDEEIKKEYETNKDRDYLKKKLPDPLPSSAEQPEAGKADTTTPPADPNATPAPAEGTKSSPAAETAPTADAKDADTKKADEKTSGESKEGGKSAPSEKKSSSFDRARSLDGEQLALADESLLAQNTKGSDEKTPDTKTPDAKTTDGKAADAKSADTKASETTTPDAKASDAKTPDAAALPPIEYEPLDKVADKIRDRLADQKVSERIQKAFEGLMKHLSKYRTEASAFRAEVGPKPQPLDIAALAKQYGVEGKETEMISAWQALDDTDLGKSSTFVGYNQIPFIQLAYGYPPRIPPIQTFDPKETFDNDRNAYLWWKVEEEKSKVPHLAEIKPEVVKAWKLIEARKPAQKKAEELAAEVRKAGRPMSDVLTGSAVATAGPFSWLDRDLNQRADISKVSGVTDPGREFMEKVFSLEAGGVGVATNKLENTFYVVQVEKYEPDTADLENGFMSAMASPITSQTYAEVGARERASDGNWWSADLQKQLEFKAAPASESGSGSSDEY
jgi:hypothetical protein